MGEINIPGISEEAKRIMAARKTAEELAPWQARRDRLENYGTPTNGKLTNHEDMRPIITEIKRLGTVSPSQRGIENTLGMPGPDTQEKPGVPAKEPTVIVRLPTKKPLTRVA